MRNGNRQMIGRVFSFMRPYGFSYAVSTLAYSSQSFFVPLLSSLLMRWVTGAILRDDPAAVITSSALFFALIVVYLVLLALAVPLYVKCGEYAKRDLKASLFHSYTVLDLESHTHSGQGIAALNTEADLATELYGSPTAAVLSHIITIVLSCVVIFSIDIRMGFLSVATGLVGLLLQTRYARPLGDVGKEQLRSNGRSVEMISNMLSGAVTIRSFMLERKVYQTFDAESQTQLALSYKNAWITMLQNIFLTAQGWLTLTGVFVFGSYLTSSGALSFASLMMIPTMSMALTGSMSGIGGAWAQMQPPIEAARRIGETLDEGEKIEAALAKKETRPVIWDGRYALSIDALRFRYRGGETDVLQDISLHIPENTTVALIGESGSGKSTLLRALVGLYQREDLPICVGNMRFSDVSLPAWRKLFAYVDQSCTLFRLSIADNIRVGNLEATDGEIIEALRAVSLIDFIETLPDGILTLCGEGGVSFSGGQQQRIAIARALVRKAPILVFDEVTSALDAKTEESIMRLVAELGKTHTVLFTTHHLRYAELADRTVVMKANTLTDGEE